MPSQVKEYAQKLLTKSQKWEKEQWEKRFRELRQAGIELSLSNIPVIVEKMSFRVRSKEQPEDCPCYRQNSPCHPNIKDLNCFVCACPQYDSKFLQKNRKIEVGKCKINSRLGIYHFSKYSPRVGVFDCSYCAAYHNPKSVEIFLREKMGKLQALSKRLSEKLES